MTGGAQLWEAKWGVEREKRGGSESNNLFLKKQKTNQKTNGVQFVCNLCAFAVINFYLIRLGVSIIVHHNWCEECESSQSDGFI